LTEPAGEEFFSAMMYEEKKPKPTSFADAIARNVRATEIGHRAIGTFRTLVDLLDATIQPEDWAKLERAFADRLALASGSEAKLDFAPGCRVQLQRGLALIRAQRPADNVASDRAMERV
jgi:hypothetical protein